MQLRGKTIAVTGATGFLGAYLALDLCRRGARVRAVVRSPEKGAWLAASGVGFARADLMDRPSLVEAFRGVDAIVSNAALFTMKSWRWADFYEANMVGTENVFRASAEVGVKRLVCVSSMSVYRHRWRSPISEDAPKLTEKNRRFSWAYEVTKALGEARAWELANKEGQALSAVRPGPIYGQRDRNLLPLFESLLRWPLLPAPTCRLPFVHAADVAQATNACLENDVAIGRAYNLGGESTSVYAFLKALKRTRGKGGLLLPLPLPLTVGPDTTAARRDLGFSSRPLAEGLEECFSGTMPGEQA